MSVNSAANRTMTNAGTPPQLIQRFNEFKQNGQVEKKPPSNGLSGQVPSTAAPATEVTGLIQQINQGQRDERGQIDPVSPEASFPSPRSATRLDSSNSINPRDNATTTHQSYPDRNSTPLIRTEREDEQEFSPPIRDRAPLSPAENTASVESVTSEKDTKDTAEQEADETITFTPEFFKELYEKGAILHPDEYN